MHQSPHITYDLICILNGLIIRFKTITVIKQKWCGILKNHTTFICHISLVYQLFYFHQPILIWIT